MQNLSASHSGGSRAATDTKITLYVRRVNTFYWFFMFENIFCIFGRKNVRKISDIVKVLCNFVSLNDRIMKHRIKELIKEKG